MIQLPVNSSFSPLTPQFQLAWDSTSLGALKTCPRFYYLWIVRGLQPGGGTNVHLQFGIWFHEGTEEYDRLRAEGQGHEASLRTVVRQMLEKTWDRPLGRGWISEHPQKHRVSLLRALVWYLDQFGATDPIETVLFADGKPAVELSFRFEIGEFSSKGEALLLCGHIDRLGRFNDQVWGVDKKTTTGQLDDRYFAQFHPDNQVSLYDAAGQVILAEPLAGFIIDGVQIGSGFARFQRRLIPRSQSEREEWLEGALQWIRFAESCAERESWPMNDKACVGPRGECQFRGICSKPPSAREQWIKAGFKERVWDPLRVRGEEQRG